MNILSNRWWFPLLYQNGASWCVWTDYTGMYQEEIVVVNSLSASLLLNIFLSLEVGIAHAIANFKWKENTSSLEN